MMNDLQQIRFITTNYPNLKGLKMSVVGFLVLSVALWANTQQGPNPDLIIPLTILLITVVLNLVIERYYRRTFGRVKPNKDTQKKNILASILGGIFGIMAFFIDTLEVLPVSIVGIVFTLALLYEYWRIINSATEKPLSFFLWFALVLFVISILPALGFDEFWSRLGFVNAILGVLALTGIIMIIMGLLVHFFLLRSMSPGVEVSNDQPV